MTAGAEVREDEDPVDPRYPFAFLRDEGAWTVEEIRLQDGGGSRNFRVLELDGAELERVILEEMGGGIDVYYDRRWKCGLGLSRWLLTNGAWGEGKHVLILGAGLGIEAAALAMLPASGLMVNDLSPVALSLCVAQVLANVPEATVEAACGRFEEIDFGGAAPDLAVASFVVYDSGTRRAMVRFLDAHPEVPLLLANEMMPDYRRFRKEVGREFEVVWREVDENGDCVFDILHFPAA